MKQKQKPSRIILSILLSILVIAEIFVLPVSAMDFSTENLDITSDTPSSYNPEEDSTFVLANSDVQISDNYLPESAYISEIEASEWQPENNYEDMPEGVVSRATVGDPMVYLTQRWLNQEYGDVPGFGSVPENGRTGWDTIYGLTRALQIELGITSLANNFGPTTARLYGQNPLHRQDGITNKKFAILQGALWCKGYSPGYYLRENADGTVSFDEIFNENVERAVIQLKKDAGFTNPDGVVTVNLMKALLSMDAFKLLSSYGGDVKVREMQQKLNRKYEAYTGLTPCDGVYGRNTNKAVIYALQAEEGLPTRVANGNFGNTTKRCCPQIPYARNSSAAKSYSGSYYTQSKISAMTELVQFALYVNGFGDGVTDGIFDAGTQQAIRAFQKKYAIPQTGIADKTTWLSLFISCGDTDRSAKAADCATILTAAKAKSLYDNGYRYIGRYLTGTYNGGISKAITREEAQIIFDAGLNFFPIYQTSARSNSYFTEAQGKYDAKEAIKHAAALGIPRNTIIYFAVDFDCMDYQITSNIIPYFRAVHETMVGSIYRTGIYGTRNACTRVSNMGYACSSFVGDMSTGFSGNLGFSMPDNWAFDQFKTTTIGSGAGYLEIDKDGFSGKDHGVSRLELPKIITGIPEITLGKSFSDELVGPIIDILGYKTPAFKLPFGYELNFDNLVQYEDNLKSNTRKITIGLADVEKPSTKEDTYKKIKELVQSFSKAPSTSSWNSFQGTKNNLKQMDFKWGISANGNVAGFIEYDLETGIIREGGIVIIANVSAETRAPVYPLVFLKFGVEGNIQGTLKFVLEDSGKFGPSGDLKVTASLKAGLEADILIANAYAGVKGALDFLFTGATKEFAVDANFYLTAEFGALLWGKSFEWRFANLRLYPRETQTQAELYSITKDDLEFIEPINRISTYSNDPDVFLSSVQTYCSPQILSLGNNKMIMLYIDDSDTRSAENRTTLMYSIFDGIQWSSPLPVYDDGTIDYEPKAYSDGNGGAHIIWQNAKTVFNSEVTLDEMSAAMELQYIHWNGSSFDNATTLTSNNAYETKHHITAFENNISVIWQENSTNDPFGIDGTNQIYRKQFKNGAWKNTETVAAGLNPINSIDTAYIEGNNVVAYTAKTNSNSSSTTDLEVFYFDGAITTRLTNDDIPDYSVSLLEDELYWISNDSVVFITNGNAESKATAIAQLPNAVSAIQTLQNANGQKAIVWSQEDDSDTKVYGSYYNTSAGKFGAIVPLTDGNDVIRGWDTTMLPNGQIQLSYCAAEMLEESVDGRPYGQLDLIQKSADSFSDIFVDPIVTYDEDILPNETIMLTTNVYNVGSEDITQLDISVIAPNGNVVQSNIVNVDLPTGMASNIEIPFTLPSEITKSEYTLKITPHNKTDISLENNQVYFTIGFSDLAIQKVEEVRTGNNRQLVVTIVNNGYETADGIFKVIDKGEIQEVLSSNNILQLNPGQTVEFTYAIDNSKLEASVSGDPLLLDLKIESETDESNYINNNQDIYIYPDYAIELTSGVGGTVSGDGVYMYNSIATLTATPNPGYIFAGWYENGQLLDNLAAEYSFDVLSNRTLEAVFILNNLTVTNTEIFGALETTNELIFTINTTGGNQPYQWEVFIYRNDVLCYSDNIIVNFFEWTPTEVGDYSVVINVTDASNFVTSYTKQFTIT